MRPVPIGIPGALYMGGEGVTRGYLHRPDLTAERFIPNPYGPPGSRLYQVGDLVRYLPTGELDFLGRLDTQVKVRGFRIELGEIESALTRHPEVREAAVLAMPEDAGGNRLVAYVESARDLAAGELRSLLKQSLPDYMIPLAFVLLRELPLTPNGKIDRRTLAACPSTPEESRGSGEPRSPRLRGRGAGGDLERRLRAGGGGDRQLLRSRRAFPARHPGGLAHPRRAPRRAAAPPGLRGAHRGRPGGVDRAGDGDPSRHSPAADRARLP